MTAPKPSGIRQAIGTRVVEAATAYQTKQQAALAVETPVRHALGKLVRLGVGGGVLIIAYRVFDGALALMLKADTLRVVDCVRVGLGLLIAVVAAYIAAPDRTVAGLKIAQALALSWKKAAAP